MSSDSAVFWRGVVAGGAAGALLTLLSVRACQSKCSAVASASSCGGKASEITVSTTNSGVVPAASGGAVNVYETSTAVSEYIMFHYGDPKDVLPYAIGPHDALQFPQRCGRIVFCGFHRLVRIRCRAALLHCVKSTAGNTASPFAGPWTSAVLLVAHRFNCPSLSTPWSASTSPMRL
jgi:hypothetical protein